MSEEIQTPEEKRLSKELEFLKAKIDMYEQNGSAKLYYSLNRKMNEMADMLNASNLKNIDIGDPKDKTFDRLKYIWNDASSIAIAVKSLGDSIGITGDEAKDVGRKPFLDRLAEPRA